MASVCSVIEQPVLWHVTVVSVVFAMHECFWRRLHHGAAGISHIILDEVHDHHANDQNARMHLSQCSCLICVPEGATLGEVRQETCPPTRRPE